MSWYGTMNCIITNQTGATSAVSQRAISGRATPTPPRDVPPTLGHGQSVTFKIHVGSGGSDEWTVRFHDARGNCLYRQGKQCDVEEDDLNSGQPVHINLLSSSQGFSIELPSSSSCTDNRYYPCA